MGMSDNCQSSPYLFHIKKSARDSVSYFNDRDDRHHLREYAHVNLM